MISFGPLPVCWRSKHYSIPRDPFKKSYLFFEELMLPGTGSILLLSYKMTYSLFQSEEGNLDRNLLAQIISRNGKEMTMISRSSKENRLETLKD